MKFLGSIYRNGDYGEFVLWVGGRRFYFRKFRVILKFPGIIDFDSIKDTLKWNGFLFG
jgi:hypothetical protein